MIRIAGVVRESIVDGDGIRFTLFTQGCYHNCKGCHNPETHDVNGGYLVSVEKVLAEIDKNPLLSGITFSGGDPILQADKLIPLAKGVVERGLNCYIYSGYTLEELLCMGDDVLELLSLCDTLIDGKFVEAEKDLTLQYRGSRNQRVIALADVMSKVGRASK